MFLQYFLLVITKALIVLVLSFIIIQIQKIITFFDFQNFEVNSTTKQWERCNTVFPLISAPGAYLISELQVVVPIEGRRLKEGGTASFR